MDKVSSDVSGGVLDIGASIAVAINSKTCNKKGQEWWPNIELERFFKILIKKKNAEDETSFQMTIWSNSL